MPPTPRTLLARLLHERHWTVDQFVREFNRAGRRAGADDRDHAISRRQATRWVAGRLPSLPHPVSQRVLETMFGFDAVLLLAPPDGPLAVTTPGDEGQAPLAIPEEMSPSRRRDLLSLGVVVPASSLVAVDPVDRAARISRAIAASTPDPLTLAQLQQGIHQLTTLFSVTPHADLVAPIERAWEDAETLLDSRVTGPARLDLELAAGQFAFYRGRLAFDMDDKRAALTFLVLAGQHAETAGDSLLAGSVATMRSSLAFFSGEFTTAANIARRAQPGAHPYIAPVLAFALARALALTGDADGALDAMRTMHDNIWSGPPQPGLEPGDEEAYEAHSAVTLSYLDRGDVAEHHARNSLDLLAQSGRHVQLTGTHLALARAFLRRPNPDPEQAASAVADALHTAAGNNHGRTETRAAAIYHRLAANSKWASLDAVRDLAAKLPAHRALPSASEV